MKNLSKLKKVGTIIQLLIVVFSLTLAVVLFLSNYENPLGLKAYAITSGSMEPAIKTGSLVFTTSSENISVGDIITFKDFRGNKIVTHRVTGTEIDQDTGEIEYTTKGDANEEDDYATVEKEDVSGKLILAIPYLGIPLLWTKGEYGYIFLIVIPATIIIYSEFLNIRNEVYFAIKKRRNNNKITTIADINNV